MSSELNFYERGKGGHRYDVGKTGIVQGWEAVGTSFSPEPGGETFLAQMSSELNKNDRGGAFPFRKQ